MLTTQIADLDIGLLFIFAVTALGVYSVVLAGWSANSKYSLLGGLRSSAQMFSYELSLGMPFVGVIMLAESFKIPDIVESQAGWFWNWNLSPTRQFLAGVVYFISAAAEVSRTPFDLPEGETELVAGYHTEYSSMKFAMMQMAEYLNIITVSVLTTNLFLGGWHPGLPFLPTGGLWGLAYFAAKVFSVLFVFIWMRGFTAAAMVQRYGELCQVRPARRFLTAHANLAEVQQAALSEQCARLSMGPTQLDRQVLQLQGEVERRTEWALEREQTLQKTQEDNRLWVASLEGRIQDEQAAHGITSESLRHVQELYATVLASSSWRLTRPLRAGRRVLANLKQARAWNPLRWPLLLSQAVRTVSTQGLEGAITRLQVSPQNWVKPASHPGQHVEPVGDPEPPASWPRAATGHALSCTG